MDVLRCDWHADSDWAWPAVDCRSCALSGQSDVIRPAFGRDAHFLREQLHAMLTLCSSVDNI